ncbi:hypothetical protein FrEUN1fDRAFT_2300 [Parafrankia sp. EUN1f]|nr:hypothetical protein FrEUN1fDRAFT_2300 [Parafrankia sp. EUN1f]
MLVFGQLSSQFDLSTFAVLWRFFDAGAHPALFQTGWFDSVTGWRGPAAWPAVGMGGHGPRRRPEDEADGQSQCLRLKKMYRLVQTTARRARTAG